MERKSAAPLAIGSRSPNPSTTGTESVRRASWTMPKEGSTPQTSDGEPAMAAASRATSPVPMATSRTRMPATRPERSSARRRYHAPVPSAIILSTRS